MKAIKTVLTGLTLLFTLQVNAGLIPVDVITEGDSKATLDEANKLEWLDLNQNSSTFANALADWGDYGFRIATQAEVTKLFATIGMVNLATGEKNFEDGDDYASMTASLLMLGGLQQNSEKTIYNFGIGTGPNTSTTFTSGQVIVTPDGYETRTLSQNSNLQEADYYFHALMVRDAPVVSAPEPASYMLMLLALGFTARKLRKS